MSVARWFYTHLPYIQLNTAIRVCAILLCVHGMDCVVRHFFRFFFCRYLNRHMYPWLNNACCQYWCLYLHKTTNNASWCSCLRCFSTVMKCSRIGEDSICWFVVLVFVVRCVVWVVTTRYMWSFIITSLVVPLNMHRTMYPIPPPNTNSVYPRCTSKRSIHCPVPLPSAYFLESLQETRKCTRLKD